MNPLNSVRGAITTGVVLAIIIMVIVTALGLRSLPLLLDETRMLAAGRKLRAALRAYRRAYRINPNLDGVEEVIQSLERMLGEGRK